LLGDRLNLSTTANLRNSPIVDSQLSTSSVPGGVVITESDRNDTNLQRLVSQLTGRVIIPPAQILPVMAENDMVNAEVFDDEVNELVPVSASGSADAVVPAPVPAAAAATTNGQQTVRRQRARNAVNQQPAVAPTVQHPIPLPIVQARMANLPASESSPANFLPGLHADTKLLDVAFTQFGTFAGMINSVSFIHENFVRKVRDVFCMYMRALLSDKQNMVLWKKYLLLPVILFSSSDRKDLSTRIRLLEQQQWDSFTLGYFQMKKLRPNPLQNNVQTPTAADDGVEDVWTPKHVRTKQCLLAGNITKAMSVLDSTTTITPPTTLILEKLRAKHPEQSFFGLTAADIARIRNHVIDPSEFIQVDVQTMRSVIQKCPNMVAHGLDKLRFEHLKQLVGTKPEPQPQELEFCSLLKDILNIITAGGIPAEALPAFKANHVCGLPKEPEDVRPIGMGAVLRKIAAKAAFPIGIEQTEKMFGTSQLAFVKGGIEHIVHAFQIHHQQHPDHDLFAIDGDNAFNSAMRAFGLMQILLHCKPLFPMMRQFYLDPSVGFVVGMMEGIEEILSKEGFHQGDVMAVWGYAMTMQPLINGLLDIVENEFQDEEKTQVRFYVDDGNLIGPHRVLVRLVQYIQAEGKKYGFKIKLSKGKFLIGKRETVEEAQRDREEIISLGLSPNVVLVHPSNDNSGISEEEAKGNYGAKILGSFVGDHLYIKKMVSLYIAELRDSAQRLMSYPDYQGRWVLFSRSFVFRPVYILRSLPPTLTKNLQQEFEAIKKQILCSLMELAETALDDPLFSSCNLSYGEGGLGLHCTREISQSGYISSIVAFAQSAVGRELQIKEQILADNPSLVPHLREFKGLVSAVVGVLGLPHQLDEILEMRNSKTDGTVQSWFNDQLSAKRCTTLLSHMSNDRRAHFRSLQSDESSKWLQEKPRYRSSFILGFDFVSALRSRLYLPQYEIPHGTRCTCNRGNAIIDERGLHLGSGCGLLNFRKDTHDSIVFELDMSLKYLGYHTKREEQGIFQSNNPNDSSRPDITVYNFPKCPMGRVALDVTVVAPLIGAENGVVRVPNSADAADKLYTQLLKNRYNGKVNKYKDRSEAAGYNFYPIVVTTTGTLHAETRKFLKSLCRHASEYKRIPASRLYNVVIRRLEIALQNGVARAITRRIHRLNPHSQEMDTNPTFRYENIMEVTW
jgi:hypothetical protein